MDHKIECGLCHSTDNPCVTPCSHSFCRKCIMKWIDDNNPDINCPLDTCEQPFGSFIHSGNRRYVIEMIYPGEAPPKRRLVIRKPAEQRLAGGPAPSDQPPGEGGGALDGARDDQSSRGSGYGPSGRHGDQRDERGEGSFGFGGGLGGFGGGNYMDDYSVSGGYDHIYGNRVYDYRHLGFSNLGYGYPGYDGQVQEGVRDGDRLEFAGSLGELSGRGGSRGNLTDQNYLGGRRGFGGQERTAMFHDYRTEAPHMGGYFGEYRSGRVVIEFGDRVEFHGGTGGDRTEGYGGNRGGQFFGDRDVYRRY